MKRSGSRSRSMARDGARLNCRAMPMIKPCAIRFWPRTKWSNFGKAKRSANGSSCPIGSSMSWSRKARALAVLSLALATGACGFRPLYGDIGQTGGVQSKLSQVVVDPIPDRLGQKLRQDLLDRIEPRGESGTGRYHLLVKLAEAQDGEGIRSDLTYARVNYRLF